MDNDNDPGFVERLCGGSGGGGVTTGGGGVTMDGDDNGIVVVVVAVEKGREEDDLFHSTTRLELGITDKTDALLEGTVSVGAT